MSFLKKVWRIFVKVCRFIVLSSEDPRKVSLMVKGIVITAIPAVVISTKIGCELAITCLSVDETSLSGIAEKIGQFVFMILTLTGIVITVVGAIRKAVLTIVGENEALK